MHELHQLSPEQTSLLEDFLNGDDNPNGLDFVATHGFLTSITVGPTPRSQDEWLNALFDDQAISEDEALSTQIRETLIAWQKEIHASLYHGQTLSLPCELRVKVTESTELNDWCLGFMEGVFINETAWYDDDEDVVADLTLPMMVFSDLIDEPELQQLRKDPKFSRELCEQIPDVLTELYLHFHAPDTPD